MASPVWAQQSVVIVLDDSGSMNTYMASGSSRLEVAKQSLGAVISSLPDDTRLGIVLLNGNTWEPDNWFVPFGKLDKPIVDAKLKGLSCGGGTPLAGAMKAGADALLAVRGKERFGNYKLLVVTDGEADDKGTVDMYVTDIMSRGIILDAIGLDMTKSHSLATQVHSYKDANNPEQLVHAISATFAETSSNDPAAAAEDFALLEGLPDGMADKIIDTLAIGDNHPIGEVREIVRDASGNIQFSEDGNVATQAPAGVNVGRLMLVAIGVLILLAIMIAIIAR
jgi:hypothetical protein